MDKTEAKEKFRLADRLFAEQQFGPALRVLTELNAAFPNERHVLYPMARCLTGLGRNAEALDLADRVARQFNYPPALDLYRRLKEMKTGTGLAALESQSDPPAIPGAMKFDSDPIELPGGVQKFDSDLPRLPSEFESMLDRPASAAGGPPPPLPSASSGPDRALLFWVGLAVFSFVVMIVATLTVGGPALEWQERIQGLQGTDAGPEEIFEGFPAGSFASLMIVGLLTSYVFACFPGYWALRVVNALPHGDFGENMKDVALWTLWGLLLFFVVIIGWIAYPILLKKHYDLSFGQLAGVIALWMAFDIGLSIGIQIAFTILIGVLGA